MKKIYLSLSFLVVFLPAPSMAGGFTSGNQLLALCKDTFGSFNNGACLGYVSGVADSIDSNICLTPGVTVSQLDSITKKYMNEHPEKLHYSASSIIREVLIKTFPCPGKRK
jgi:hypothetical protein